MSAPCAFPFPMVGVWAAHGVGFGAELTGFPIVRAPELWLGSASQLWALKPGHAPCPRSWGKRGEIHFIHVEMSLGLLTLVHPLLQLGDRNWVISPKYFSAAL